MTIRRFHVGWFFGFALSAFHRPAFAEEPRVRLDLVGCSDRAAAELSRLVAIEIGDALDMGEVALPTPRHIAVVCDADGARPLEGSVHLAGRDASSARTMARDIILDHVPPAARPRLLAIAVGELFTALWGDRIDPDIKAVIRAPEPAPSSLVEEKAPSPVSEESWRLGVAGSLRHSTKLEPWLAGGGLYLERKVAGHWAATADVLAEAGSLGSDWGNVDALLLSASLSLALRADLGAFRWQSGLGARIGMARLAGVASTAPLPGKDVTGKALLSPWGGPMLTMAMSAVMPARTTISLGIEVGYATTGVRGEALGERVTQIGEFWSALSLRAGWAP